MGTQIIISSLMYFETLSLGCSSSTSGIEHDLIIIIISQ